MVFMLSFHCCRYNQLLLEEEKHLSVLVSCVLLMESLSAATGARERGKTEPHARRTPFPALAGRGAAGDEGLSLQSSALGTRRRLQALPEQAGGLSKAPVVPVRVPESSGARWPRGAAPPARPGGVGPSATLSQVWVTGAGWSRCLGRAVPGIRLPSPCAGEAARGGLGAVALFRGR